jgi:hypothetical protein
MNWGEVLPYSPSQIEKDPPLPKDFSIFFENSGSRSANTRFARLVLPWEPRVSLGEPVVRLEWAVGQSRRTDGQGLASRWSLRANGWSAPGELIVRRGERPVTLRLTTSQPARPEWSRPASLRSRRRERRVGRAEATVGPLRDHGQDRRAEGHDPRANGLVGRADDPVGTSGRRLAVSGW